MLLFTGAVVTIVVVGLAIISFPPDDDRIEAVAGSTSSPGSTQTTTTTDPLANTDTEPTEVARDRNLPPEVSTTITTDPSATTPLDLAELVAEFEIRGATVTQISGDVGSSPFLTGEPRPLCVNGQQVWIYEYDTVSDRALDSVYITSRGQMSAPGRILLGTWVGTPRFFATGRLIALHLSSDADTLKLLVEVFGPTLSPDVVLAPGFGLSPCDAPKAGETGPTLSAATVEEAANLIVDFVDALTRGNHAEAQQLWTGYPSGVEQASREFDRFVDDFGWLASEAEQRFLVVPSFGFIDAAPVVTVVADDRTTVLVAPFVLSVPRDGQPLKIERLPSSAALANPVSGSIVGPGDDIVFSLFPVEGSARIFLDEDELVASSTMNQAQSLSCCPTIFRSRLCSPFRWQRPRSQPRSQSRIALRARPMTVLLRTSRAAQPIIV